MTPVKSSSLVPTSTSNEFPHSSPTSFPLVPEIRQRVPHSLIARADRTNGREMLCSPELIDRTSGFSNAPLPCLLCFCSPEKVGPGGWGGPEGGGREGGGPQSSCFFPSRRKFRSLWGLFSWNCGCGSRPWLTQSARFGFSGVILCEPWRLTDDALHGATGKLFHRFQNADGSHSKVYTGAPEPRNVKQPLPTSPLQDQRTLPADGHVSWRARCRL